VGQLEVRTVDQQFVVHQEVEVQSSRPPALLPDPTGPRFDPMKVGEQVRSREGRLDQPHRVEIGILLGSSNGGGLIERRHCEQGPRRSESVESHPQKSEAVTHVGPEPDGRADHNP
jgi:hypothetical protein